MLNFLRVISSRDEIFDQNDDMRNFLNSNDYSTVIDLEEFTDLQVW